jgi:CHAD domain-containing protein
MLRLYPAAGSERDQTASDSSKSSACAVWSVACLRTLATIGFAPESIGMQQFLVVEAGERAPQRLRQKALDLTDEVIVTLGQVEANNEKAIHDVRRRFKELRALTELFATTLADRGRLEQSFFRDRGRQLAAPRDAKAALEVFDRLRERYAGEWTPRQFQKIRGALAQRVEQQVDAAIIERLRSDLLTERGRIAAWPVDAMTRDDLWQAITRSYRRARRAMRAALRERTAPAIHAWRKRVKVHWHHAQFFALVDLAELQPHIEQLHKLSQTLGEHHDLVVLDQLCQGSQSFGSARYVQTFRHFIARRLADLEEKAESAGPEIFGDRARTWMAKAGAPQERQRIGPKKSPRRAQRRSVISA